MTARKVLMLVSDKDTVSNNQRNSITSARLILERMGYRVVFFTDNTSQVLWNKLTLSDYEFCVIPNPTTSPSDWLAGNDWWDGTSGLTCFVLGVINSGAVKWRDSFGANTNTGAAYRKWIWRGIDCWGYGADYTLNAALDTTVFIAEDPTRGTGIKSWRLNGSVSNVYADSSGFGGGEHTFFPMLLQEAIDAGDIQPPSFKIPLYFDIDDFPDPKVTAGDIANIYNLMTAYNVPMTWGLAPAALGAAGYSAASDYMLSVQSDPLVHMIDHDHSWNWQGGTKATIDSNYRASVATLQGYGFDIGVDYNDTAFEGYRYFTSNWFDENSLQLMSPMVSKLGDKADAVIKKGYGYRVVRTDIGNTSANNIGSPRRMKGVNKRRKIAILPSSSDLAFNEINLAQTGAENVNNGLAFANMFGGNLSTPRSYYLHAQNFMDAHDGGNQPGFYLYEGLIKVGAECKDIVRFSHPSQDY